MAALLGLTFVTQDAGNGRACAAVYKPSANSQSAGGGNALNATAAKVPATRASAEKTSNAEVLVAPTANTDPTTTTTNKTSTQTTARSPLSRCRWRERRSLRRLEARPG